MKTVTDMLTLPGWFVLDACLIKQVPVCADGIKGFEWHVHQMPDEWMVDLKEYYKKETSK